MPQPKTPKSSRIRDRQSKRRTVRQRHDTLVNLAASKRADLIGPELDLRQLKALPTGERSATYDDDLAQRQKLVADAERAAAALEAEAELVLGKKLTADDKDRADQAVRRAKRDRLNQLLDHFETTLDQHLANIVVLDAVPDGQRDDYAEAVRDQDGQVIASGWEDAREREERAVVTLERAIEQGEAMLDDLKAADPAE